MPLTRNAILGGGISGMAAGHYLMNIASQQVTLHEASDRIGGWIKSITLDNGIIFEQGPRTIRPKGPQGANTLKLIEELGLTQEVIPIKSDHPTAQNRMIYINKQLHTLPSNASSLFQLRSPFSRPLFLYFLNDLIAQKKITHDESIYDFTKRRFGEEVADFAISPMICGICAGDAKEISVKFLMNNLFEKEQKYGSIFKGMLFELFQKKKNQVSTLCELAEIAKWERWSVWSLKNGLETLPKALKNHLMQLGVNVHLRSKCERIEFADRMCRIVCNDGKKYEYDRLISALPSRILARLVQHQHPKLADDLASIPSVTVGVVNLQYKTRLLNQEAFGFLVPASENLPILGVIFDSCCFPNGENTILTVMMGGRWFEKNFGQSPPNSVLLETSKKQIADILNIKSEPENYSVSILKDCIPQYVVGHNACVERIRKYIAHHNLSLHLVGSAYDGVGINDVIYSAKKCVDNLQLGEQ